MKAPNNPFPGPQPYGAEEQLGFFGRVDLRLQLEDVALSHRTVTVFGPSGAGKSSLLQAAVIPSLTRRGELRCVTVDAWPPAALAGEPGAQLALTIARQLDLDAAPATPAEAVELAFHASPRPLLLVLDQLEQLLVQHSALSLERFILHLVELHASREGVLHVLLALREDDLGRWSSRLTLYPQLIRHTFRVQRLTVEQAFDAVRQAAASGEPPQHWSPDALRPFLEGVTVPGAGRAEEAEVESAYVQIVCRQLWAEGGPSQAAGRSAAQILERYLSTTLTALGPLEDATRRLLETRLIHARSGRRLQVSRGEVVDEVGDTDDAARILAHLETARVLRARLFRGEALYELGHDWLAAPIRAAAAQRSADALAAKARRARRLAAVAILVLLGVAAGFASLFFRAEQEAERALIAQTQSERARQEAEDAQALAEAERGRAEGALSEAERQRQKAESSEASAIASQALALEAKRDAEAEARAAELARDEADVARSVAEQQARQLIDAELMRAARELSGDPWRAAPFLARVEPASLPETWYREALRALHALLGEPLSSGALSPRSALLALPMGLVFQDSEGRATLLEGSAPASLAEPSASLLVGHAGSDQLLLGGEDGGLQLWSSGGSRALPPHPRAAWAAAFDASGARLLTADRSGAALLHALTGSEAETRPLPATGRVFALAFVGELALTCTLEGELALWDPSGGLQRRLREAGGELGTSAQRFEIHPDGDRVLVAWSDGRVEEWDLTSGGSRALGEGAAGLTDLAGRPGAPGQWALLDRGGALEVAGVPLPPEHGPYRAMAFSPDGATLATGSEGGRAALWTLDAAGRPVLVRALQGHAVEAPVTALAFAAEGRTLHTGSAADGLRRWDVEGGGLAEPVPGVAGRLARALAIDDAGAVRVRFTDGSTLDWPRAPADASASAASLSPDRPTAHSGPGASLALGLSDAAPLHLDAHLSPITQLALSPGGRWLVSASEDGAVLRWRLPEPEAAQAGLRERARSCVSAEDQARLPGEGLGVEVCR